MLARAVHLAPPMRRLWISIALSACTGTPCKPVRLADAPDASPGEVRHGFAVDQEFGVTALSTAVGVACLTCGGAFYFDPAFVEQRRVGIALEGSGSLAIGGDTTFVLDRDFGENPETHGGDSRPPHYQLFALSASGHEIWRNDLGAGGPWAAFLAPDVIAGLASVVVYGEPVAAVFDPATGAQRWSTPIGHGDTLAPDPAGGLLVASSAHTTTTAAPQATLRHLDAGGAVIWSTVWTATLTSPPIGRDIIFDSAAPTASGGFLVTGEFSTATLDIGGSVLQGVTAFVDGIPPHVNFIASLDASGTTQWAFTLGKAGPEGYIEDLKVAALRDGAAVCGVDAGAGQLGLPGTSGNINTFVLRIDAGGTITAHAISGGGEQRCAGLAAASDGSAIVTLESDPDYSTSHPSDVMVHVGSRSFTHGPHNEFYVLNIVL